MLYSVALLVWGIYLAGSDSWDCSKYVPQIGVLICSSDCFLNPFLLRDHKINLIITYACVYTHMHMYVCICIYVYLYIWDYYSDDLFSSSILQSKNTLCCIKHRMYNDCVKYAFQKMMEVDLLLWHICYFSL